MNTYLVAPFATALLIQATSALRIQEDSCTSCDTIQLAQATSELRLTEDMLIIDTASDAESLSVSSPSSTSSASSDSDSDSSEEQNGLAQVFRRAKETCQEKNDSRYATRVSKCAEDDAKCLIDAGLWK